MTHSERIASVDAALADKPEGVESESAATLRRWLRVRWGEVKTKNDLSEIEEFASYILVPLDKIGVSPLVSLQWKRRMIERLDSVLHVVEAHAAIESVAKSEQLERTLKELEATRRGLDARQGQQDTYFTIAGIVLGLVGLVGLYFDYRSMSASEKALDIARRQYALDALPSDERVLNELRRANSLAQQQYNMDVARGTSAIEN